MPLNSDLRSRLISSGTGSPSIGRKLPIGEFKYASVRLPNLKVLLKHGDTVVDRGMGSNVLDSPLLALAHLVDALASQSDFPPLSGGEIVSTGTMTDAAPVAPGETWHTEFPGGELPGLAVRFE